MRENKWNKHWHSQTKLLCHCHYMTFIDNGLVYSDSLISWLFSSLSKARVKSVPHQKSFPSKYFTQKAHIAKLLSFYFQKEKGGKSFSKRVNLKSSTGRKAVNFLSFSRLFLKKQSTWKLVISYYLNLNTQ